jgi:hypothetical protein
MEDVGVEIVSFRKGSYLVDSDSDRASNRCVLIFSITVSEQEVKMLVN